MTFGHIIKQALFSPPPGGIVVGVKWNDPPQGGQLRVEQYLT